MAKAVKSDSITVPTPGELFAALSKAGKINWSAQYRAPIPVTYANRAQIALNLGGLIADGFIAVEAKDGLAAYRRLLERTVAYRETVPDDLTPVVITPSRHAKLESLLANRMEPRVGATLKSNALILQQIGAFLGMLAFSMMAVRIGRRLSFAISFTLAWAAIYMVFLGFHHQSQIWYMYPLLGFCTLLPFGGYAVYFPELFPTRLRTTGTGFCYNVGRYISALGPPMLMNLSASLVGRFETPAFRVSAVIVSSVYIIGIVAAFMGPETKDQPLPEDERVAAH